MRPIYFIVISLTLLLACNDNDVEVAVDYRHEMREFVMEIAQYSRQSNPSFMVIPQNGQELITSTGYSNGILQTKYLQSINAVGREDLFYGYTADDKSTPLTDNEFMLDLCLICKQNNVNVLTTDYCWTKSKVDDSYSQNYSHGFISFAANKRELTQIPDYPSKPFNENDEQISSISQAQNFLYLINPVNFETKQHFVDAVSKTNYDVVIMDLFHFEDAYTKREIEKLKTKQNGSKRLVICYMSIGEAEDYRYYWQNNWHTMKPKWIESENKDWKGNYEVRYWYAEWKEIIYGQPNAYLDQIIEANFDGVYLDLIDAFEYFEAK